MSTQWRKSKSKGPFRVTASKRGVSTSVGFGPLRFSRGADGKTRRTVRIPGTGLYQTEVIGEQRPEVFIPENPGSVVSQRAHKRRPWQVWFGAAALAFLVFMILI